MTTIHMPETKPLPSVSPRLVKLETVIEDGISMFIRVGKALMEINKDKLYRETASPRSSGTASRSGT